MKRLGVPVLLTVVVSVILLAIFMNINLMPTLASSQGAQVDRLVRLLIAIAVVIFALCVVFLAYGLVSFRRKPGDLEDAPPIEGSTPLEIAWTVVPLIIVLSLGAYGAGALFDITAPPSTGEELEVKVTGFQWAWRFEYPQYGVTSTELVLPVNQPVLFRVYSTDVIHSFYVPEFRLKIDTIPGVENKIRITPQELGEYKVRCAELCGTGHAYMLAPVKIVEEAAFQEWITAQKQTAVQAPAQEAAEAPSAVEAGRQLAQQMGCTACHSVDGSKLVGPTWKGLFGEEVTLDDGTTVVADEEYLRRSIVDPGAQIVQGFPNVMPKNYKDQLTEEQIQSLIEYIKSLRE